MRRGIINTQLLAVMAAYSSARTEPIEYEDVNQYKAPDRMVPKDVDPRAQRFVRRSFYQNQNQAPRKFKR